MTQTSLLVAFPSLCQPPFLYLCLLHFPNKVSALEPLSQGLLMGCPRETIFSGPSSPFTPSFITLVLFVDSSIFYLCLPALLAWAVLSLLGLFPPDCLMGFIHRQLWWGRPRCPPCSLCYSPGWEVGRLVADPELGKRRHSAQWAKAQGAAGRLCTFLKVCAFQIKQQHTPPRISHYCLLLPLCLGLLPALWGTKG